MRQRGTPGQRLGLERLIERAHRDPYRIRAFLEQAFDLGAGSRLPGGRARDVAARLRRRARVTAECDGRAILLEMADELTGLARQPRATGATSGPIASSGSKEGRGQL